MKLILVIFSIFLVFVLAWYEHTIRKLCDGGDILSCAEIAGGR